MLPNANQQTTPAEQLAQIDKLVTQKLCRLYDIDVERASLVKEIDNLRHTITGTILGQRIESDAAVKRMNEAAEKLKLNKD
jgi:FKBP-type peptidyl-prolyl cis-trans isomerase (trigger factor)